MLLLVGSYAIPHSRFLFPISPGAPWSVGRMTFEVAGTGMCTTLICIPSPSVSLLRTTVDETRPRPPYSRACEAAAVGLVPYPASSFLTTSSSRLVPFLGQPLPSRSGAPDSMSRPPAPGDPRGLALWLRESSILSSCLSADLSPFRSAE